VLVGSSGTATLDHAIGAGNLQGTATPADDDLGGVGTFLTSFSLIGVNTGAASSSLRWKYAGCR